MDLIIVESPTKAKTLSRFLGSDFQIEASMGHLVDLPKRKLGVDIKHDFKPDYEVSKEKAERVKQLQDLASKAKKVILATDPDREGEAISWHIANLIKNKDVVRITFHEITETAIQDALKHPGEINMQLVDAQQARRILDRLVGYKLSPLLWRKIRKGLSAGRVQSVAVRLISEREREIQAFKPVEYWDLVAQLKSSGGEFEAKFKGEIKTQTEAGEIVGNLEKAEFKVVDVQKKEVRRNPYPPFTTSTLQQTASNLMGWSAKRTMQIAQNLYEQGIITYHRTDSTNLATEALSMVRGYIDNVYGKKYLPDEPRLFKTKSKVAQEAHEAIRPTSVERTAESSQQLDRDQAKLYDLIWKRFVSCQMTEALYEQLGVDISASNYMFRANGNKQLFDGWKKLYAKLGEEEDAEQALPGLSVGERLDLVKLNPAQHFTEPPPRFTEASLIKALEEHGIGRPSTYAPIISTIQERQYVEKTDKKLVPTNLGFAVNDFLMANFPSEFEYSFTAKMEDQLDEIANGEKQWVPVIRGFYEPFSQILEKTQETAERVKIEVESTDEVCPNDGSPLVVRIGKFGKFLACSKFPDCKFTKPFQNKVGIKCPKCKEGDVILKKTKSKRSFFGCSRYPECDFASWTKPKIEEASQTVAV